MKFLSTLLPLSFSSILIGLSCTKETTNSPTVSRKVQFLLYTNKDFSANNDNIIFKLSIQKPTNQILWDSILPTMVIKDIPKVSNKLVIEKVVPGNDPSLLKVGFYYTIENVGNSWYLDSFKAGETFKVVDFNFQ